jgi:hypothetical protein
MRADANTLLADSRAKQSGVVRIGLLAALQLRSETARSMRVLGGSGRLRTL